MKEALHQAIRALPVSVTNNRGCRNPSRTASGHSNPGRTASARTIPPTAIPAAPHPDAPSNSPRGVAKNKNCRRSQPPCFGGLPCAATAIVATVQAPLEMSTSNISRIRSRSPDYRGRPLWDLKQLYPASGRPNGQKSRLPRVTPTL